MTNLETQAGGKRAQKSLVIERMTQFAPSNQQSIFKGIKMSSQEGEELIENNRRD